MAMNFIRFKSATSKFPVTSSMDSNAFCRWVGLSARSECLSVGPVAVRVIELYQFATGKNILPYASSDLISRMDNPIRFRAPTGGSVATGYEAEILTDICDAVLAAREAGALRADQLHIARQCEILVRGFARVGIIALVDEATGFQRDRTKDALARILEAFVAKELQPWVKNFPERILRPTLSVARIGI